jgi:hypothetical protein
VQAQRLLTSTGDPSLSRVESFDIAEPAADGEVLLAVRRVALTTNNITYALFGDRMQYWQFFPSGQTGWGIVPVWGFADVVASRAEGLAAGERVYGYLPLASHLRVQAAQVSRGRFVDAAPHRAALAAIYNQYLRCAADPSYREAEEAALAIVKPLFTTAWLLADFFHEQGWFGARQVVLSSASSKTAYATAWCLRQLGGVQVVGLTSPSNIAFVQGLGCYDQVLAYDAVASLEAQVPTVFADFSGSADQRARLHRHFGDALKHSAVIGATQFSAGPRDAVLPGAKPAFFFAPEQARRRAEAWGGAELQRRVGEAQRAFLLRALDPAAPWLRIEVHEGLSSAIEVMAALARGQVDPRLGHAVRVA